MRSLFYSTSGHIYCNLQCIRVLQFSWIYYVKSWGQFCRTSWVYSVLVQFTPMYWTIHFYCVYLVSNLVFVQIKAISKMKNNFMIASYSNMHSQWLCDESTRMLSLQFTTFKMSNQQPRDNPICSSITPS